MALQKLLAAGVTFNKRPKKNWLTWPALSPGAGRPKLRGPAEEFRADPALIRSTAALFNVGLDSDVLPMWSVKCSKFQSRGLKEYCAKIKATTAWHLFCRVVNCLFTIFYLFLVETKKSWINFSKCPLKGCTKSRWNWTFTFSPWHICAHLSESAEDCCHQPARIPPAKHLAVLLHFSVWCTHRGADLVAHPEVEAALLIHRVVDAGKFGELRPVVLEGVIQQTVVRAARKRTAMSEVLPWQAWS